MGSGDPGHIWGIWLFSYNNGNFLTLWHTNVKIISYCNIHLVAVDDCYKRKERDLLFISANFHWGLECMTWQTNVLSPLMFQNDCCWHSHFNRTFVFPLQLKLYCLMVKIITCTVNIIPHNLQNFLNNLCFEQYMYF